MYGATRRIFNRGAPPGELPRPRPSLMLGVVAASVVILLLVVWAVIARRAARSQALERSGLHTTTVERRDFVHSLRIHGVVEAVESHTVSAPRLAGSNLGQMVVTKLVPSGTSVKKGDLLVEFDRQNEIKNFLDQQATYRDLEDQIKKTQATQAADRARDETQVKQAEDTVKSAELEILKNEVISKIDAEKNQEALEEASADLKQLRETFDLKRRSAEASLRLLEIQRERAVNAMRHAQENADKMTIHAPIDGLVVLNSIWKGGRMAEVQEGDEVRPGVVFLQVVDPRMMRVRAKINQTDAPYLKVGQTVQVRLDAYPDLVFPGKVGQIGAIGLTSGFSDKVRTFQARFSIQGADPRLMPDLSAAVDVELERVPNVLVAPRDAVVTDNGKTYARVKNGSGFEKRAVKAGAVNDVEVVIESGLQPGEVVERNAGVGSRELGVGAGG